MTPGVFNALWNYSKDPLESYEVPQQLLKDPQTPEKTAISLISLRFLSINMKLHHRPQEP